MLFRVVFKCLFVDEFSLKPILDGFEEQKFVEAIDRFRMIWMSDGCRASFFSSDSRIEEKEKEPDGFEKV